MPTYDYQCRSCGAVTEVIHSMLEEGPRTCDQCGGELRRILYPAGIIFKGSGFYRTDSRKTESGASSASKSDTASTSTSTSESSTKASGGTTKPATGGDSGD